MSTEKALWKFVAEKKCRVHWLHVILLSRAWLVCVFSWFPDILQWYSSFFIPGAWNIKSSSRLSSRFYTPYVSTRLSRHANDYSLVMWLRTVVHFISCLSCVSNFQKFLSCLFHRIYSITFCVPVSFNVSESHKQRGCLVWLQIISAYDGFKWCRHFHRGIRNDFVACMWLLLSPHHFTYIPGIRSPFRLSHYYLLSPCSFPVTHDASDGKIASTRSELSRLEENAMRAGNCSGEKWGKRSKWSREYIRILFSRRRSSGGKKKFGLSFWRQFSSLPPPPDLTLFYSPSRRGKTLKVSRRCKRFIRLEPNTDHIPRIWSCDHNTHTDDTLAPRFLHFSCPQR